MTIIKTALHIITLLLTTCALTAYGQTNCPKPLRLDKLKQAYPPGHTDAGAAHYFYSTVYPIGWSKDGKFAFINDAVDDIEAGEKYYSLQVTDTKTDSLVFNWKNTAQTISSFWKTYTDTIQKVLKHFAIHQQDSFNIRPFPIRASYVASYPNDWIFLNISPDSSNNDQPKELIYKNHQHLIYKLISTTKGVKTIFRTANLNFHSWDHYVHGYLKSPFENRIVIINTYGQWVTCGGNYTGIQTGFIGASLDYGFN